MLIYGRKVIRRELGWVGDFCPLCLCVENMHVWQLRQVDHIYWLPVGSGKLFAHEITCKGCTNTVAKTEVNYSQFATRPTQDVAELAATTCPDSLDDITARLDVEDRITTGRPTDPERLSLIAEPIAALEYLACKRLGPGMLSSVCGVALFALVVAVAATFHAWTTPSTSPITLASTIALIPLFLAFAVYGFFHGPRAWVRDVLMPKLASPLARLNPSTEELQTVLSDLARQKYLIGKRVRPDALAAAINACQVKPSASQSDLFRAAA